MGYRQILVHLDDDDAGCRARLAAALAVAKGQRDAAKLVGTYIVSTDAMSPTLAAVLPDGVVRQRLAETGRAQQHAHRLFAEVTGAAGVEGEWRAPAGAPVEALVAHARCSDLVVLGQPTPDGEGAGFAGGLAEAAIEAGGRPVLVVPYIGAASIGRRVIVAWDGSREAARAVADAMPLLAAAGEVRAIAIDADPSDDTDDVDPTSTARLTTWLAAHGIVNLRIDHDATESTVGEWLLSRAADYGADLIVMGGYSHARLRERVLGGVTRTLLRAMTVPVLFSH